MLVKINNKKPVVSSKDIADTFGKVHRNVMRDIINLECSDQFRMLNFEQSNYTSLQNKELPCYEITRDGFAFLCMGFTGVESAKWKEKYITAFNQMESALNGSIEKPILKMEDLNAIAKNIEKLNEVGSFHGKGLSDFRKNKNRESKVFKKALSSAQMVLNIK